MEIKQKFEDLTQGEKNCVEKLYNAETEEFRSLFSIKDAYEEDSEFYTDLFNQSEEEFERQIEAITLYNRDLEKKS